MSRELTLVLFVQLGKVRHVVEEDGALDHSLEGRACSLEDGLDVGEALARLVRDAALDELAGRGHGDLARDVEGAVDEDGLGVGSEGCSSGRSVASSRGSGMVSGWRTWGCLVGVDLLELRGGHDAV